MYEGSLKGSSELLSFKNIRDLLIAASAAQGLLICDVVLTVCFAMYHHENNSSTDTSLFFLKHTKYISRSSARHAAGLTL